MQTASGRSVGSYLDEAPVTRGHWKTLGLLGAGGFFDGFDIYLAGSVLSSMVATHFLTVGSTANFVSSTFAGLLVGTLLGGKLGDVFGRRTVYLYSLLVYGLFTVLAVFAVAPWQLVVLRGLSGVGLGAVLIASYGMWSEIVPRRQRGRWGGLLALMINISQPVSAGIALLVIPDFGWRAMFVIAGVPAFVVWMLQVRYLGESPRWLEARGRLREAYDTAREYNPATPRYAEDDAPGAPVKPPRETGGGVRTRDLFRGRVLRPTIVASVVSVCFTVPYYAFQAWVPTYLVKAGHPISTTLAFTFLMQLGAIPGNLLGGYLGDRFGRRKTLAVNFILLGLLGIPYSYPANDAELVIVGFVWVTIANIMITSSIASYVPEVFPTDVRMQGSAFANAVSRAGTVVSPYAVTALFLGFGAPGVFLASLLVFVIGAIVVLVAGFETRNRSLEEIAARELGLAEVVPGPSVPVRTTEREN